MTKVVVIGMGYVGIPAAALIADVDGYEVLGFPSLGRKFEPCRRATEVPRHVGANAIAACGQVLGQVATPIVGADDDRLVFSRGEAPGARDQGSGGREATHRGRDRPSRVLALLRSLHRARPLLAMPAVAGTTHR